MGFGDAKMAFRKATATIRPDSPRHAAWVEVFGSDTVVLEGPLAHVAWSPAGVEEHFYMLDLSSLSDAVRYRLVTYLSHTFGITEDVVRDEIDQGHGVPILAKDVTILVDHRHFTRDWL